jgi:hypothetical protein
MVLKSYPLYDMVRHYGDLYNIVPSIKHHSAPRKVAGSCVSQLALFYTITTSLYIYRYIIRNMKINNKIPWGLAIGMLGITIAGAYNGTA